MPSHICSPSSAKSLFYIPDGCFQLYLLSSFPFICIPPFVQWKSRRNATAAKPDSFPRKVVGIFGFAARRIFDFPMKNLPSRGLRSVFFKESLHKNFDAGYRAEKIIEPSGD
ncbi:hypothetical protein [Alistipes indistinctus]|uniref:hypothetical protein n=1 Tax=Alistipes indistinctus TaxID=626932 RepID=UPI000F63A340